MNSIIGKRDFFKFYLRLFGFCFFFFIMGLMTWGIFIHDYSSSHFMNKEYGLLVMLVALITWVIYIIYRFYTITPSISINHDSIKLNRAIYYWTDLEDVQLSGKRPYIMGNLKEGVLLKFKEHNEIYFLDMYQNTGAIKLFIQHTILEKNSISVSQAHPVIDPPNQTELESEQFITYKKNQFFNFRSLILWLAIIGLSYAGIIHFYSIGAIVFYIVLCAAIFQLLTWYTNYFEVSNSFLVIRNHNSFGKRKVYRLSDINEIIFEQEYKMPNAMRVITKNFESERFFGSSLWDKQWRGLRDDLAIKGIPIKDEFIHDEVELEFIVFKQIRETFSRFKK